MTALPVHSVSLEVNGQVKKVELTPNDKQVVFDFELKEGHATVQGLLLDAKGKTLAGAYYVYAGLR